MDSLTSQEVNIRLSLVMQVKIKGKRSGQFFSFKSITDVVKLIVLLLVRFMHWHSSITQRLHRVVCHCLPSRKFSQGAGMQWPTLCEAHCVIFNVHQQQIPTKRDLTQCPTSQTVHSLRYTQSEKHQSELIVGSGIKLRLHSSCVILPALWKWISAARYN